MAWRLAPNKAPWTDAVTFLSNCRLVRSVIANRSGLSSGAPSSISLMCWVLKQSGPLVEPLGNDWMAVLTATCSTWRGGISDIDGAGRLSAGAGGWRQISECWLVWNDEPVVEKREANCTLYVTILQFSGSHSCDRLIRWLQRCVSCR